MGDDHRPAVHVIRPLDLAGIDAIGFDLDHTLAVYDDARVNAMAYEEACASLADAALPMDPPAAVYDESQVCRGLLLDTATGRVLKPDARGRVRRALRGGSWLSSDEIGAAYPAPVGDSPRFHAIHSPFDLPTAFLYQRLPAATSDFAAACRSIRHHLDRAHTRGRLKERILDDVDRLVRPLASDAAALERFRDAGKSLFVLTNSEPDYSVALLDRLFGERWRALFDVVATDAGKPMFFRDATPHPPRALDARGARVVARASARWLESTLGVDAGRVLYLGDSVASDTRPAQEHGWRTAHIVQELGAGATGATAWGAALFEDETPTWFAAMIVAHADVYAARVGDLLAHDPASHFLPGPHPLGPGPRRDCP